MSDPGFSTGFSVDRTPAEVFDAITNVRGWWSEEIDGGTSQAGDEFTYRYEDVHRCTMRVTEAEPGRRVCWLVLDNHFNFTDDQSEWTGTTISFDIVRKDGAEGQGSTEVRFAHHGLVPGYECFEVCSSAWGFYVTTSLKDLITTGTGQPNRRGQVPVSAEQTATARAR